MTGGRMTGAGARDLDWEGCYNARDLGGLELSSGGVTPLGRVVRADSPDRLSPAAWAAAWDFGIRTIIDLRRDDERAVEVARPPGLVVHQVSWDDYPDPEWRARNQPPGLPGSMRPFLRDYPDALADTARILVDAAPGAVLVHCAGGRDRTGLLAITLGALVGVTPEALFADYEYSFARLLPMHRLLGYESEIEFVEAESMSERRAWVFDQARTVIGELDAEAAARVFLDGGLSEAELAAVRTRLMSP